MHHDYLIPKCKCFQLSLKLSIANVLPQRPWKRVPQTWTRDAEAPVAEADVYQQYHACPVGHDKSRQQPLLVTRLMWSAKYLGVQPDSDWCIRHATLYR